MPETAWLQRRRDAALAGHRGDPVAARAFLHDEDPRVRATALGAVARALDLTEQDIVTAMADASPEMRRRAATEVATLAQRPQPGLTGGMSILSLLDDPDPSVVEVASWACGEQDPPDAHAVAKLAVLAVDHEDALVREAAVAALGSIGDPDGLAAILSATTDKPAIRRRAALALAPFDGPEVDEALERARTDRDWQVRQAAEDLTDPS